MTAEDQLQIACMKWLSLQYPNVLAFHVPNGGSRNRLEGAKLKKMGVRRGIPDVFIDYPRPGYHGARFELKVPPNKLTKEQEERLEYYRLNGWYVQEVWSFDEFREYVNYYMGL